MSDEVKRGKGRPPGSKTFRPDPPVPSAKMRDLMAGSYTDEEWIRRYKLLPIAEQFRLRGGAEPKVREDAPPGNFTLKVYGLGIPGAECPGCGRKQGDAINPGGGNGDGR